MDFLDADDDGLVDEEELKQFLSGNKDAAAMFQVKAPAAPCKQASSAIAPPPPLQVEDASVLIKMFDKDGSGALDVSEMYSLRQFLADKKAKVNVALRVRARVRIRSLS